jgi:hypothetical protein
MGRFPFFVKKEVRVPTWRFWLTFLVSLGTLAFIFMTGIVPYLSTNHPEKAEILSVEGYMPDYAMKEAMHIFQRDGYKHMVVTGNKRTKGAHLDQYANDGEFSAAVLFQMGFDSSQLTVVAVQSDIRKDRTYHSALALGRWLKENRPGLDVVDIVSLGCHARRSRYLFQKALGDSITVGVHSVPDQSFNPKRWWKSSHGFREITKETIAWIYARWFFRPE